LEPRCWACRLRCLRIPFRLQRGAEVRAAAATAPQAYKESPTQFKEADGWKVAEPQDATLRGSWWEIFNEPELNALEDQLNINNQNIRESFENYMEARALVREARSQYFPTVSVGPAYSRSQTSSNLLRGPSPAVAAASSRRYSSCLAKYRGTRLLGQDRNTVRSQQYTAQVTAADLANEKLTEQASLAEYFLRYAARMHCRDSGCGGRCG